MQIHSVGIDLGKTTFHLVALGTAGKVLLRKKFTQKQLLTFTANMQTSLIGLEACSGAHFLGRALQKQGHDVRLIAAQFVKPFVKSNKNDFVDAEAIAEAVERNNMRFVPIKTDDQLDLQAIHRVRDRLISRRTAVINQLRAFLLERGMVFAQKPAKLKAAMADVLENAEADLTPLMRNLIDTLWSEWKLVEQQIEELNDELERISASDAGCTRIRQIPGIGPVVATAIVAAIGIILRDAAILDEMESRCLVRTDSNRQNYFPTLGTFALLSDDDDRYRFAQLGTLQVLHTLVNLYETREPSTQYTADELVDHVRNRYDIVNPEQIRLGLYLSVSEFGAVQSFGRSQDGISITSFTIAETVLKISSPEIAWQERILLSRNNASTDGSSFESKARLQFELSVARLYDDADQQCRKLVKEYENAGIAESGHFARTMTDFVIAGFKGVEDRIREFYLTPVVAPVVPDTQRRLKAAISEVIEEQTTRAQNVARNLCISFVGPMSDRMSSLLAHVEGFGKNIEARLLQEIVLLGLPDTPLQSYKLDSGSASNVAGGASHSSSSAHPTVFVSYAWEEAEHRAWVRRFAARLRESGIDAVLDQWELDFGDNRLQFMERVASVDNVLVICSRCYKEKSDSRVAGVGYESNIITSSMAEQAGRQKFIPVLRSGDWTTSVPVWLKHASGPNLTGDPYSETEFENLLRTLHRKRVRAPALGPIPSFDTHIDRDGDISKG